MRTVLGTFPWEIMAALLGPNPQQHLLNSDASSNRRYLSFAVVSVGKGQMCFAFLCPTFSRHVVPTHLAVLSAYLHATLAIRLILTAKFDTSETASPALFQKKGPLTPQKCLTLCLVELGNASQSSTSQLGSEVSFSDTSPP